MNWNFLRKIKHQLFDFFKKRDKKQVFSESDLIYNFLSDLQTKEKVMFDVGAHFGESFAPYENLGWSIFAFEPNDDTRKKINFNPKFTKLFDYAITNTDDKEMSYYKSDVSTGIAGLSSFHTSHRLAQTVLTKTLKTFCKEHFIYKINFLKIDTEGFDLFVLEGFDFETLHPEIIMCEFEDIKTIPLGYTYIDLGDYLISKGYRVYISEWEPIVRYGIKHNWKSIKEYPENILENTNGWGNFIAVDSTKAGLFEKALKKYQRAL